MIQTEKLWKVIDTPILTLFARILDCYRGFQKYFFEGIDHVRDIFVKVNVENGFSQDFLEKFKIQKNLLIWLAIFLVFETDHSQTGYIKAYEFLVAFSQKYEKFYPGLGLLLGVSRSRFF